MTTSVATVGGQLNSRAASSKFRRQALLPGLWSLVSSPPRARHGLRITVACAGAVVSLARCSPPKTAHRQSPLYPLPPFGTGGNMAFRRDVLKQIGGFDCALGAGTVSCGGEDTAALSTVPLVGGTIVYQPSAIVHHYHRKDYAALRSTLRGYGRGLTSFYTSMLVHRPGGTAELLRIGGQAVMDHFSRGGRQFGELSDDFPHQLLWANRIGLLQGPFTYAAAQVHARRLRRAAPRR